MAWPSEIWRRLRTLFRRERFERELEEEMRFHLEMQAEENREEGMDSREAGYAARRQFGNEILLKEGSRETWSWRWLESLARDIRVALRMMLRSPTFTLVAVLTLSLGLGANMAIFAMLHDAVLQPVRYANADRLMDVRLILTEQRRGTIPMSWSYPKFEEVRQWNQSFEALAAFRARNFTLGGIDRPERLTGEMVTAPYFRIIGIGAALGRVFLDEEDLPARTRPVILISDGLWRRSFAADPGVVGRTVRVNERAVTIVGVLPQGFKGESGKAEVWMPVAAVLLTSGPENFTQRRTHNLHAIGYLKPGVNARQADEEVRMLVARMERENPTDPTGQDKWSGGAQLLQEAKVDPTVRRGLWILQGAAIFVLLIACLNLASLLLGRGLARRREIAIRLALGVSRPALTRQLLVEPVLLALLGGAAGLALASWGIRLLVLMLPETKRPIWYSYMRAIDPASLRVEMPVAVFALLLSLAAGVLFGLLPALRAARWDVNEVLKSGGAAAGGLPHLRLRNALVAAQIALALVLLDGAGLMLRSFSARLATNFGSETRNILTLEVALPGQRYNAASSRTFFEELRRRATELPGVEEAAVADTVPVREQSSINDLSIEGRQGLFYAGVHPVSPEYFRLFRIPLIYGRQFDGTDRKGSPLALIINEMAARRFFPGENPLGQHMSYPSETQSPAEIIGVVGDVRYGPPEEPVMPDVYLSSWPGGGGDLLAVRTSGDPQALIASLRRQVSLLDPELPVYDVLTMEQQVTLVTWRSRFSAVLLGLMSALALLLAVLGTYGVFSYSVAARTHDIGIRIALGAGRKNILHMVLREGILLCSVSLAFGLPLSFVLARLLSNQLYGVKAGDPLTFVSVVTLLVAVALAASYVPARRATTIDALEALHHE